MDGDARRTGLGRGPRILIGIGAGFVAQLVVGLLGGDPAAALVVWVVVAVLVWALLGRR
ncbi:hypothetical protein ACFHW1_04945 [Micromonospora sp. LOL_014]|uniref:hypothetical protein n=1 Tax=Micromonospora sp. LOL_014 TaxID=3345415 RepID=UPI003A8B4033